MKPIAITPALIEALRTLAARPGWQEPQCSRRYARLLAQLEFIEMRKCMGPGWRIVKVTPSGLRFVEALDAANAAATSNARSL